MDYINIIGLTAGTLCTISFLPQVIKIWRSKSAQDVSLSMFTLFSVGIVCWIIYGFLVASFPIIGANLITLLLALVIIAFKLKYK